ncbi:MAG: FG-GAP repeat protein [Nitrospira sp.]
MPSRNRISNIEGRSAQRGREGRFAGIIQFRTIGIPTVTTYSGGSIMISLRSMRVERRGLCAIAALIRQGFLVWCAALLVVCGSLGPRQADARTSAADTIPASLSAEEWQHIHQAVEKATYEVREGARDPGHAGVLEATNLRHKLRTEFLPEGVRIVPTGQHQPAWRWGMTLRAYGYEGHTVTAEVVQPIAEGNRVEYRRGALVEWYVNEGRGLEQGFTLAERPGSRTGTPLFVDLAVDGSLAPRLEDQGTAVRFEQAEGQPILRYRGLVAVDATGHPLHAQIIPLDGGVRLQIEDQSAIYPLTIDPTIINESAKLLAADGVVGDEFGISMAIAGDTVVVGAQGDDDKGSESGAAYVFVKPAGGWTGTLTQSAKLLAADGAADDWFGSSVAIAEDTVAVGAQGDDDKGDASGAAYVFVKLAGGWTGTLTQSAKLLAADGAASDLFGSSVAIAGDTVVVGARLDDNKGVNSGAAYVFVKPAGGWIGTLTQSAKLLAADGTAEDQFGSSVAIAGDTVAVGALYDDDQGVNSGAAYVFVKPAGGWIGTLTQSAKLLAAGGTANDEFGYSVAIAGDTVAVGARSDDEKGNTSGSGYVFRVGSPNTPPVCTAAQAFPFALWAPNHQFVPVVIMGVTDPDGDSVTLTVTGVTQDEPVKGPGSGNMSPDAVIQAGAASVRAERAGTGNGRVYHVSFTADDGKGGSCTGAVTVGVPHSLHKGTTAIDDGQKFDSTIP